MGEGSRRMGRTQLLCIAVTDSIVGPPPRRKGRVPKLENRAFRDKTIQLATAGMSRRGVANLLGESEGRMHDWLARGAAQPEVEPYGSWQREYCAAERAAEALGVELQSQTLGCISRKSPQTRTMAEIEWVGRLLATRFPKDHGNASAGTGNARVAAPEPDPEAWWQKHGLQSDQLRALLRDPPESVAEALVAEGDAIYARLIEAGWRPPRLTKGK